MPRNDYTDRSRAMPRRQSRDTEVDRSLMTRFSSSHVATNRIGEVLQNTLVELLDLALQAKHARWTVTGPALLPLHTQLDALSVQMQAAADEVAERAVTIGYAPDGRCSTVATDSPLPELPTGLLADHVVVDAIGRALSVVTEGVHGRVERLDQLDQVSHDMLIGVLRGLDKQRWMFEAQRA